MRNKIWKKSILIMVSFFLVLSFVNIIGASSSNDMVITSRVNEKLQNDSQLMGSKITVETINGEVTLKGMVNSEADITRAAMLARSIDGVKNVDNKLQSPKKFGSSNYSGSSRAADCPVGANWSC